MDPIKEAARSLVYLSSAKIWDILSPETEMDVSDTHSNLGENQVVIRRPFIAENHSMWNPS